jgi:hypothetical protein
LSTTKGKVVTATCIVAREYDVPAGVKPVEWHLLTKRLATSAAGVAELIAWYRARWEVEMLLNVLKNGCTVEELQLGTVERIERGLALYLVVAWRIAHLMRMERTCPDLDATLFVDPYEIQAAYLLNKQLAPPAPTLTGGPCMVARRRILGEKKLW